MKILKDEEQLLLDHEYDGIKELDNSLPPWWLYLFYITIGFAVVYFIGYELEPWFNQPDAEYRAEVAYYTGQGSGAEDSIEEKIARGKKVYVSNCVLCHGLNGEGKIGPNLTDDHWQYGKGNLAGIYKVVEEGTKSGMQSWKKLGPKKMSDVSQYVLSLRGTNPPNPRKPEGKKYPQEEK